MAGPSNPPTQNHVVVARTVANAVEKELEEAKDSMVTSRPTIWKVPSVIRKGDKEAYEPTLMPIGPFHRKKKVASMSNLKLLYVGHLLARSRGQQKDVNDYALAIAKHEKEVRQEYSECIHLTSEEFVKLLVIDGCFVVEYLLKRSEGQKLGPLLDANTTPTLKDDLLLMENQIPWLVLDIIFEITSTNNNRTLLDLALHFLHKRQMHKYKHPLENWLQEALQHRIYHLLHLSYLCLREDLKKEGTIGGWLPPETLKAHVLRRLKDSIFSVVQGLIHLLKKARSYLSWVLIVFLYIIVSFIELVINWKTPTWYASQACKAGDNSKKPRGIATATELKDAGVDFKRKENARCYLDVSFEEGTMDIAQVNIEESSRSKFRNLLALEQYCLQVGNHFTSYVVLMDNLIDTAADVALLKRVGIIESKLGSDQDVANFFNGIRSGLCFDFNRHYLVELFKGVEDYRKRDHNRWRAKLMHDYFGNPWAIISVLAAIILLGLTAVQSVYSVKSYNQEKE